MNFAEVHELELVVTPNTYLYPKQKPPPPNSGGGGKSFLVSRGCLYRAL
jgi:hypothetical protein